MRSVEEEEVVVGFRKERKNPSLSLGEERKRKRGLLSLTRNLTEMTFDWEGIATTLHYFKVSCCYCYYPFGFPYFPVHFHSFTAASRAFIAFVASFHYYF